MSTNIDTSNLFDEIFELPDPDRKRQFDDLVGLDELKARLLKEARLLLNSELLADWSQKHHGKELPSVRSFRERPPLFLFSGDVGTGKTTFAESFGDPIARQERIAVRVFRLSLMTRGRGAVGEMTHLITRSFEELERHAAQGMTRGKKPSAAAILIIDEADALAESRATEQMHHEDRAGVNALIRGVDRLTRERLPALVVMCTNREDAIDPAVLRRATGVHRFVRPNEQQRLVIFERAFDGLFREPELRRLVELTGRRQERPYGYTYSDLTQRLIPTILLQAFPDGPVTFELAAATCLAIEPTKPFGPSGNDGSS